MGGARSRSRAAVGDKSTSSRCARNLLACLSLSSVASARLTACPVGGPAVTYRWVNSDEYLYVEGAGGCVTLSDIYKNAESPPLVPMTAAGVETTTETGIWLLTKNLYMESGTTLLLHDDLGCDELRLASSSSNAISLRGHGAYISLLRTKVFSWSKSKGTYDLGSSDGSQPRSFISLVSERTQAGETCSGRADDDAGEARMDITNSEVAYLGYQSSEAYGISYKVRGYCTDESNPEIFDRVNVRGDVRFSDIHHNWFGLYTYGHQDGLWEYNQMHENGYYGFDPHDDSDNLRIHNNVVWGNGNHGIIASKRCNDVSIQNNHVYDNDYHGIMLHRSSDSGIIRNNTVVNSGSACIALFESFDIEVSGNTCEGNEEGIRLSMGSSHNKIFDNKVTNTVSRAIWFFKGSDPVEASAYVNGRCTDNTFENNYIDGAEYGVYQLEADSSNFLGNTFVGTGDNEWEDGDDLLWKDNVVHSGFQMKMTNVCLDKSSDLAQITAAGATSTTC